MNFKRKIEKLGLKKQWVADQLGVSRVMFSYYINETRPMPYQIEKSLKEFLKQYDK